MPEIEDIGGYDAIVIGAGMAGLVAGNALVRKGHRVLLLEKHAIPGGCTTNFEREGFRFEASTHVINGCEPGGMTYRRLAKIDAHDRIEFIKIDTFGRMVDEVRGTDVLLPWELDQHVDVLVKQFPHEEAGIRGFYAKYGPMAETLLASIGVEAKDDPELLARLAEAGGDFTALNGRKAVEILAEWVKDPWLVEMMLAIPAGFMGTAHDQLDAGTAIMCDLVFRVNGGEAYYPKGGSGHMSQVLADLFVENGGTLLLNRGVSEIDFSDGQAVGVVARRRTGHFVSAHARCVVAASDLTPLVNDLCPGGTFPPDYVRAINERSPCISANILYAGLDLDLRALGIDECEISRSWAGEGAPSQFGEIARDCDYSKLPYAMGVPDLARHVEVLELATPVTIRRFTENRDGATVGWRYSPEEAQEHFPQRSPVPNLFLCGHWVAPGGGVSNVIAGGNNASELADAYLRS